jgi:hypothetical protein
MLSLGTSYSKIASCLLLQRKASNRQCSSSSKTRRRIVETLASGRREGGNTFMYPILGTRGQALFGDVVAERSII